MPRRQDRFGYGTSIPPTTARVTADLAVTLLFMPANLGATLVSIY